MHKKKEYYIEKFGPDYFVNLGRKGGRSRKVNTHYIATIGGCALRDKMAVVDPDYYTKVSKAAAKQRKICAAQRKQDLIKQAHHEKQTMTVMCVCGHAYTQKVTVATSMICSNCHEHIWFIP